jgi:hypothetical protein
MRMKPSLKITSLLVLASAMLFSCKKDETRAVVQTGTPPVLNASTTTLVLTKATENNTAMTFTFQPADFGYKAAVTYTLQFAKPGNNFVNIGTIAFPDNNTTQAVTVKSLNIAALNAGLDTLSSQPVQVRLKADIGSGQTPVYSNVVALNIKPYSLNAFLYVPGDYQGWDPGSAPKLISINSTGAFEGFVNITAGSLEFKLTSDPDWNHTNYGGSGGSLSTSGGNLTVPTTGYYLLKANLNNLTWSATKTTWSIIGDGAVDWSTDVPLAYDAANKVWKAVVTLNSAGQIKFRANNDWGLNFGDDGANGSLEYGGANISVPSGSHTVILDLHNPGAYKYLIQ